MKSRRKPRPSARWQCGWSTSAGTDGRHGALDRAGDDRDRIRLDAPITGLRVGLYLMTTRGEQVFTSFDTDDPRLVRALRHAPRRALCQPLHYPGGLS